MITEAIDTINCMLVDFCFKNGTELIQFVIPLGTPSQSGGPLMVTSNAQRLATDSAWQWAERCLNG